MNLKNSMKNSILNKKFNLNIKSGYLTKKTLDILDY